MTRARFVLAALCMSASLLSADVTVPWENLPNVLRGKTIDVTTIHGVVHHGKFRKAGPNAIVLKEGRDVVIERDAVSSIFTADRPRFSRLKTLGMVVRFGYEVPFTGWDGPPQPWLALVGIPFATVGAVVGAPICLIWDLFELDQQPSEEIAILPDPPPDPK
jgi:hypothetical protein